VPRKLAHDSDMLQQAASTEDRGSLNSVGQPLFVDLSV